MQQHWLYQAKTVSGKWATAGTGMALSTSPDMMLAALEEGGRDATSGNIPATRKKRCQRTALNGFDE